MVIKTDYSIEFKDKPFEDLVKERKALQESLDYWEKIATSKDHSEEEWRLKPSPEVVYRVELENMADLCQCMAERFF